MKVVGKEVLSDLAKRHADVREQVAAWIAEAEEAEDIAELARVLLPTELLSASGIGPDEERFTAAVERVNPGLVTAAAA